jgi:hypothetical protein
VSSARKVRVEALITHWTVPPEQCRPGRCRAGNVDDPVVKRDHQRSGCRDRQRRARGSGAGAAAGAQHVANLHVHSVPRHRSGVVAASVHLGCPVAGVQGFPLPGWTELDTGHHSRWWAGCNLGLTTSRVLRAECRTTEGTEEAGCAHAKAPPAIAGGASKESRRRPTLPPGLPGSTIGARGLNFRVRDGTGCLPSAMATETLWSCPGMPGTSRTTQRARARKSSCQVLGLLVPVSSTHYCASTSGLSTQSSSWGPYQVNPVGDLILERASRLYAFSAYPFRT